MTKSILLTFLTGKMLPQFLLFFTPLWLGPLLYCIPKNRYHEVLVLWILLLCCDAYLGYLSWVQNFYELSRREAQYWERKSDIKRPVAPKARRRTQWARKSQLGDHPTSQQYIKEKEKVGIRNICRGNIDFLSMMRYYWYGLRFDWFFNAILRIIIHQIAKTLHRYGFKYANRCYWYYQPFWNEGVARQIGEIFLTSGLIIAVSNVNEEENLATFRLNNWYCMSTNEESERVFIQELKITVDCTKRTAVAGRLDGKEIDVNDGNVLMMMVSAASTYYHTVLHSYANWASENCWQIPGMLEAATASTAMNAYAHTSGAMIMNSMANFTKLLEVNAVKGIHKHVGPGSGGQVVALCKFSRVGSFILEARKELKEHLLTLDFGEQELDLEGFFLLSVVHSLDHLGLITSVNPLDITGNDGAQYLLAVYTAPHLEVFMHSSFRKRKEKWMQDYYRRLCQIDKSLADECHAYIRF